jgi:general secretion pathway protein G
MSKQRGFTLMEMIGVMAVIAILVSVATPMIFDAIRNAKVTAFVEDVNMVKGAVAQYYEDTGGFPTHIPSDNRDRNKRLMKNDSASPVAGWDGPYLEKDLGNPFTEGAYAAVLSSTNANYQFDLDGDGTADTTSVAFIRIDQVTDEEAKSISDIFDNDGSVESGSDAWNAAGRVKRYGVNSDHPHSLLIYISKV